MKTVKDAYEFYKGVFPEVNENLCQISEIVSPCLNGNIDTSKVGKFEVRRYIGNGAHVIRSDYWQIVCTRKEFEDYAKMQELNSINKEAIKPVYTQEMADNGELPPVGCLVVDKRNKCEFQVLLPADCNGYYVMLGHGGDYHCELLRNLEPIDTRTDKEKLIDEIQNEIDTYNKHSKSIPKDFKLSDHLFEKFDITLKINHITGFNYPVLII